jgi:hypothetical protein
MHDRQIQEGKAVDRIWNAINQPNFKNCNNEVFADLKSINKPLAQKYFQATSQYTLIDLKVLTEDQERFLKDSFLSIDYLRSNLKNFIENFLNIQIHAIEKGCIQLSCPTTGKILDSNRSLFLNSRWCFYKFEGNEVFYCLSNCLNPCLYFPVKEIIICLGQSPSNVNLLKSIITDLKVYVTVNSRKIVSYLLCTDEVKTVGVVGLNPTSTAHHIWDDLPAIQTLYDLGKHQNLHQILIPNGAEYYGGIDEIFPEIASSQVIRLPPETLRETILDNNYFGFLLRSNRQQRVVKDSLAKRITELSEQKCSADLLVQIKEAKERHFPLLWINFRLGKRTWISQVQGIANIIKILSINFPDIGIVFDGYSRKDIGGELVFNPNEENAIANEKNTLNQIKSLLPETENIYDIIGRPMYEAIVWAHNIDLYMATFGGGLAKVVSIANKPGVIHTNSFSSNTRALVYSSRRENPATSVVIPKQFIVDALEDNFSKNTTLNRSYDCDWIVIYEEVFKLSSLIQRTSLNS